MLGRTLYIKLANKHSTSSESMSTLTWASALCTVETSSRVPCPEQSQLRARENIGQIEVSVLRATSLRCMPFVLSHNSHSLEELPQTAFPCALDNEEAASLHQRSALLEQCIIVSFQVPCAIGGYQWSVQGGEAREVVEERR